MEHYLSLGIGPFFYFEDVKINGFEFRGRPSNPQLSIALANSGDLQLELIQQRNDAPSLYKEFLDRHGEGLQHMSAWTETLEAEHQRILAAGFKVGQTGVLGRNRFVYYDTQADHPASVMEIYDISNGVKDFFDQIRSAAATWDGSQPIRKFR
jgi:4-hydroxyphenylpyruvate dioxygenase-like putative hemolysin